MKKVKSGRKTYYYLVKSYRINNKVYQKTLKRLSYEEVKNPNFISEFLKKNPKYKKSKIKAIILAAGKSLRLFPYSQNLPKGLVPVGGKPILRYIINNLISYGISDIILITGFQDKKIRKEFEGEVKFVYNPFYSVSSILASIWFTINEINGPLFILYSDLLFEKTIVKALLQDKNDISIAMTYSIVDGLKEKIVSRDHKLVEIGLDIPIISETSNYAGIAKFSTLGASHLRLVIEEMAREEGFLDYYFTDALERLILKGYTISTNEISNNLFIDINTPKDLQKAEQKILPNILSKQT